MRKFNLNGSLTTEGDLNIKGTLNVAGQSVSIEQETLTVKDNFIAINGEGTTLETVGSAGIVAITGKEQIMLIDGIYKTNSSVIDEYLNPQPVVIKEDYYGEGDHWYGVSIPTEKVDSLLSLISVLKPVSSPTYDGYIVEDIYVYTSPDYVENNNNIYSDFWVGIVYHLDDDADNAIMREYIRFVNIDGHITSHSNDLELEFQSQILSQEQVSLFKQFLIKQDGSAVTDNDFATSGQAYAAPIYDVKDDALKIGLGTYEKDEKGNIRSFTFGAGQGQSIATRADSIQDGHLIKWSGTENKMVDAGKTLEDVVSTIPKFTATLLEDGSYSLVISEE